MNSAKRRSYFLFLSLAIGAILAVDGFLLVRSSAAVGVDGYYYVIQADTFRTRGHFYYPTSAPLVLVFFSLISALMPSTVLAIKVGVLIIQASFYAGLAFLIRTLTNDDLLSFLGLFLAFFSGQHLYYISEFLSNLGALTFLIWSAWSFVKYARDGNKSFLILGVGLLVGACLCHRSVPYLVGSFFLVGLAALLGLRLNTKKGCFIFGILLLLCIFLVPFIISIQLFPLPPWVINETSAIPQNPFRPLMVMEGVSLAVVD